MIDHSRYIVLLPLQALPESGVEDALRARAEHLRALEQHGEATPDDLAARAAIENILGGHGTEAEESAAGEPPLLLKISDVAALLGVSHNHVYNQVARGELPSVRIGKSRRIRRDQLLAWLDELTELQQSGGSVRHGR